MAARQEGAELLLSMHEDSDAQGGVPGAAVADGQACPRPEGVAGGQCRRGALSISLLAGVAIVALGLCMVKWSRDLRVASGSPSQSGPRASRGLVDFPRTLDRDAAISLYDAKERGAHLPQDDKVLGALSATADWMGNAFGGLQSSFSNSGLFWDDSTVQDDDHFSDAFGDLSAGGDDGGLSMGHGVDDLLTAPGGFAPTPVQQFAPTPSQFAPTPSQSLPGSDPHERPTPLEPAEPRGVPSGGKPAELAGHDGGADASDSQASDNGTATTTATLPPTTSITTVTETSRTKSINKLYQVVFSGSVNVRAWPNIEAPIHSVLWKCDHFHGDEDVEGWVTVLGDNAEITGYMKKTFGNETLVKQLSDDRLLAVVGVKDAPEPGCTRCSAEEPCEGMQWQVVHAGAVAVYKRADAKSDVVGYKWKCDLVRGVRLEGWIMLVQGDEPNVEVEGYMAILDAQEQANAEEVKALASEQLECEACAEGEADCGSSGCCRAPGTQCYKSGDGKFGCQYTCNPDQDGSGCEQVGDRSWTPGLPDWPSMFCFSLMVPGSYEEGLMKAQLAKGAGIFACDDFTVLAPSDIDMGTSPTGERVRTRFSEPAPVGVSKDGTAANTQIFFNAWDAIHNDGKYKNFAWTIKMDPDAVLIPDRVKAKVLERGLDGRNDKVYFANCNRFPDNDDFPMMYGAMEVLSLASADLYMEEGYRCMDLPYQVWGEDLYLANCLRTVLMVERIFDNTMVGDSRCMGGACWDHAFAAFHEFKDEQSWFNCYDQTHGSF